MPQHREVSVNGITMHIAEQGEGPLVLLLHGFPESWYSWRHQFEPLAAAGYHVVAPDQRGYGGTDQPSEVDAYSIFHLVGDVVGLIEALGHQQAVVVGHDWGAPVAWHTAMLRPDLVRGVAGLSVAPGPRGPVPPLVAARERFGDGFYQIYFQEPGVADAELNADVRGAFRKTLAATSGEGANPAAAPLAQGGGFLAAMPDPETLPGWVTEADIDAYTEQYQRNGFTGGLNWYRNIDRNWELTAPWQNARITAPALYISGDRDLVRAFYPPEFMDHVLPKILPDLRGVVDLPGCGHWTQQERPDEVNKALLEFLGGL
ncbi:MULTISPECIES: alpha/beta fold hydrolase [unclassified Crossiella]|uniref:alpha/beta fold hydrolase n=1 Tax=unclassified Crossiella TaxID=2620835 RepID=UPI001FFEC048|nr:MULTISPECIES: alpha/beta hydrolase [unclassified Crossiella]MCK2239790.1 alpha/beta hydrolase [Crossiella sp. S99.2]MCK2252485.1 alpha/beta hydrolase [Crossiella sp. S99.1]